MTKKQFNYMLWYKLRIGVDNILIADSFYEICYWNNRQSDKTEQFFYVLLSWCLNRESYL